jgi:hypothetical protein
MGGAKGKRLSASLLHRNLESSESATQANHTSFVPALANIKSASPNSEDVAPLPP